MKDAYKTIFKSENRRLIFAFLLFTYFYLEVEIVFTNRIVDMSGEISGTLIYCFLCFSAAAGYFSFSFIYKASANSLKSLRFVLAIVCTAGTIASVFTGIALAITFSLAVMFTAGIVGASLLYSIAVGVKEKTIMGMFIALPYAGAFLLQYIMDLVVPSFGRNESLFHYTFLAVAICSVLILLPGGMEGKAKNKLPETSPDLNINRFLKGALIAGLIVFCLFGLLDGTIMTLHVGQMLNIYGWIRLIAIPGILFTGYVADFNDGRYFPFATAISMAAAVAAVFLFNTAETFNAGLGSVYFFCSFMTMYSLVVFVRVADSTPNPAFWAAAGRGLKYLAGGIFALAGSVIFANISLIVLAMTYLALLIILFIIFYFQGKLTPLDIVRVEEPQPDIALEERIKEYKFTKRESDVLRLLLNGKGTPDIAAELVLTEHTVQKYISSMMAKSESESRTILITKFSGRKA